MTLLDWYLLVSIRKLQLLFRGRPGNHHFVSVLSTEEMATAGASESKLTGLGLVSAGQAPAQPVAIDVCTGIQCTYFHVYAHAVKHRNACMYTQYVYTGYVF